MDERGINIDSVFRNGLKDMEVLPPAGVWDDIMPSVRKSYMPVRLLRNAAMIAALMTLTFFAYRWNSDLSDELGNSLVAFNIEATEPVYDALDNVDPVKSARIASDGRTTLRTNLFNASNQVTEVLQPAADIDVMNASGQDNEKEAENEALRSLKNSTRRSVSAAYFEDTAEDNLYSTLSEQKPEKWSLGAVASPTYYSRFGAGDDESVQQLKSSEQSQISYTGGIAFYYKLSKRLSIQSGVYYSSVGQQLEGINSFTGFRQYNETKGTRNFEVLSTNGRIYTNNSDVFLLADGPADRVLTRYTSDLFDPIKANLEYVSNTLTQNFSYVELPIMLRYKVVDRTLDLNLVGGISYNMLVGNNVFTLVDGIRYNIGKTESLSPISISSSLGMGMEYSFSSSFSLNLEPTFRYYLDPFSRVEGSRMHPYSFGIFSGIRYRF